MCCKLRNKLTKQNTFFQFCSPAMSRTQKDPTLNTSLSRRWLLTLLVVLFAATVVPTDAKRKCKTVKNVSMVDSDDGPFFEYSARSIRKWSHGKPPPVGLKYDPMAKIADKIGGECKRACLKDKARCGAYRIVVSGRSGGGTYAMCALFEKGTYKLVEDEGRPSCGRAACWVGECTSR